jgi:hypothetical protein
MQRKPASWCDGTHPACHAHHCHPLQMFIPLGLLPSLTNLLSLPCPPLPLFPAPPQSAYRGWHRERAPEPTRPAQPDRGAVVPVPPRLPGRSRQHADPGSGGVAVDSVRLPGQGHLLNLTPTSGCLSWGSLAHVHAHMRRRNKQTGKLVCKCSLMVIAASVLECSLARVALYACWLKAQRTLST